MTSIPVPLSNAQNITPASKPPPSIMSSNATIEWFGTTTFRLKINGITIFLDSWLERPSVLPKYLDIDSVDHADYICISHAHFDHLPGADRLAIKTGAQVIANSEAIRILRDGGVPEEQLVQVAGGERVPLFTKEVREKARKGECEVAPDPPGAPPRPAGALAALAVDVWPSLHCLMSGDHPEVFDSGTHFSSNDPYASTLDISRGMKYALLQLDKLVPEQYRDDGMKSFIEYIHDPKNKFSHCDGGQLMYNFRFEGKAMLWNAHMGAYEGIMRSLQPKPDIVILGAAGQPNHDGRPFEGSPAEFAKNECEWLDHPKKVIWCLHDESPIRPYRVDTTAATKAVNSQTRSEVWDLEPAKAYNLFD